MGPVSKVSIFMAVTNKNSDGKGSKMAKNGKILAKNALKWQGHGTGYIFSSMSMGN